MQAKIALMAHAGQTTAEIAASLGIETVARLTEVARNKYTAAFHSHTGRWEPLPAPAADLKQTAELVTALLAPYLEP
jgi:hypothetical protein